MGEGEGWGGGPGVGGGECPLIDIAAAVVGKEGMALELQTAYAVVIGVSCIHSRQTSVTEQIIHQHDLKCILMSIPFKNPPEKKCNCLLFGMK